MLECDVLVVGAGPSGSSSARAAALNGFKVILVEKKEKPGKIECGEAIGSYLLPFLPFNIPKDQLIWKTKGMSFTTKDLHIERYGKLWEAFSIDRGKFDFWLAKNAEKSGAKLITNTELFDFEYEKNKDIIATLKNKNKKIDIKTKILIGADGVDSTVLKSLNLYKPKENDNADILSYEFENVYNTDSNLEQIYLGDYINGGYGYIFPKSKKKINIGVGSIYKQDLEKSFEEFCELPEIKKQIKNGRKIIEKSGKAPVFPFNDKYNHGNILFTGDAACQNFKPYAEGILPGIICGDICGKTASSFLKNNTPLDMYKKNIEKKIGILFKESDKITEILYDLFDMKDRKKYSIICAFASNLYSYKEIERFKEYNYKDILKMINKKSNSIFFNRLKEDFYVNYLKLKNII